MIYVTPITHRSETGTAPYRWPASHRWAVKVLRAQYRMNRRDGLTAAAARQTIALGLIAGTCAR